MHFNEHQHPFSPERQVNRWRSSSFSRLGTCAGVAVIVLRYSNPLSCALFAPSQLRGFIATMGALTPVPPALRDYRPWTPALSANRSPWFTRAAFSTIPSPTTWPPLSSLYHATPQRDSSRFPRSDFAIGLQARRGYPAESSFLSYRLVVHLLLLSTTHRCVAVALGYRPESICLKRTYTSLTTRALRRTDHRLQPHRVSIST